MTNLPYSLKKNIYIAFEQQTTVPKPAILIHSPHAVSHPLQPHWKILDFGTDLKCTPALHDVSLFLSVFLFVFLSVVVLHENLVTPAPDYLQAAHFDTSKWAYIAIQSRGLRIQRARREISIAGAPNWATIHLLGWSQPIRGKFRTNIFLINQKLWLQSAERLDFWITSSLLSVSVLVLDSVGTDELAMAMPAL